MPRFAAVPSGSFTRGRGGFLLITFLPVAFLLLPLALVFLFPFVFALSAPIVREQKRSQFVPFAAVDHVPGREWDNG